MNKSHPLLGPTTFPVGSPAGEGTFPSRLAWFCSPEAEPRGSPARGGAAAWQLPRWINGRSRAIAQSL